MPWFGAHGPTRVLRLRAGGVPGRLPHAPCGKSCANGGKCVAIVGRLAATPSGVRRPGRDTAFVPAPRKAFGRCAPRRNDGEAALLFNSTCTAALGRGVLRRVSNSYARYRHTWWSAKGRRRVRRDPWTRRDQRSSTKAFTHRGRAVRAHWLRRGRWGAAFARAGFAFEPVWLQTMAWPTYS